MGTALVDDVRHVSNEETNPFESMMERFDRAAQLLNLEPDLYAVMRVPNRELKVYIRVGSQTTPPLPPPNGMCATAHFQVIHAASAVTSSSVTFG